MNTTSEPSGPSSVSLAAATRDGRRLVVAAILLAAWVLIIYSNTLDATFHFDDYPNIVMNEAIRVDHLSYDALRGAAMGSPNPQRPVANASFALNYQVSGYDTTSYHAVNIAIHILAALGLLVAARLLLGLAPLAPQHGPWRDAIAWATAALWAVHPIQVQAITYIVQRMASMAAMFVIWSLAFFLIALRKAGWWRWIALTGSAVTFLLAIGSKETAMILPMILLLGAGILSGAWAKPSRVVALMGGSAVLGALAVSLTWGPGRVLYLVSTWWSRNPEQLLTIPRAFFYNLSLFFFPLPSRFGLVHDFDFSSSLLHPPTTILAIVGLAAVCVLPIFIAKTRPLVSVCLLWYLLLTLPEALTVKHNPIFEHRLYLPTMGLCLLVFATLSNLSRDRSRHLVAAGVIIALAILSVFTYQRNTVWHDDISLWTDAVRNAPTATHPYSDLVLALAGAGRLDEAAATHDMLMTIEPRHQWDHYYQGKSALTLGRTSDAIGSLKAATALDPGHCEFRGLLAEAYAAAGRMGNSLAELQVFEKTCMEPHQLRLAPGAKLNAATLLATAKRTMSERLARDSSDTEALLILAGLLINDRKCDEAVGHLETLLAIEPGNAAAWTNLGFCAYDLGQYDKARECHLQAIAIAPEFTNAYYGLAQTAEKLGLIDEARVGYRRYLELAPPEDAFRVAARRHLDRLDRAGLQR